MLKRGINIKVFITLVVLITSSMVGLANASTNTFQYDIEFSGGTNPGGPTPWLTSTFDDNTGNPNSVYLTMSASNLEKKNS
jgi:hypothetical protein